MHNIRDRLAKLPDWDSQDFEATNSIRAQRPESHFILPSGAVVQIVYTELAQAPASPAQPAANAATTFTGGQNANFAFTFSATQTTRDEATDTDHLKQAVGALLPKPRVDTSQQTDTNPSIYGWESDFKSPMPRIFKPYPPPPVHLADAPPPEQEDPSLPSTSTSTPPTPSSETSTRTTPQHDPSYNGSNLSVAPDTDIRVPIKQRRIRYKNNHLLSNRNPMTPSFPNSLCPSFFYYSYCPSTPETPCELDHIAGFDRKTFCNEVYLKILIPAGTHDVSQRTMQWRDVKYLLGKKRFWEERRELVKFVEGFGSVIKKPHRMVGRDGRPFFCVEFATEEGAWRILKGPVFYQGWSCVVKPWHPSYAGGGCIFLSFFPEEEGSLDSSKCASLSYVEEVKQAYINAQPQNRAELPRSRELSPTVREAFLRPGWVEIEGQRDRSEKLKKRTTIESGHMDLGEDNGIVDTTWERGVGGVGKRDVEKEDQVSFGWLEKADGPVVPLKRLGKASLGAVGEEWWVAGKDDTDGKWHSPAAMQASTQSERRPLSVYPRPSKRLGDGGAVAIVLERDKKVPAMGVEKETKPAVKPAFDFESRSVGLTPVPIVEQVVGGRAPAAEALRVEEVKGRRKREERTWDAGPRKEVEMVGPEETEKDDDDLTAFLKSLGVVGDAKEVERVGEDDVEKDDDDLKALLKSLGVGVIGDEEVGGSEGKGVRQVGKSPPAVRQRIAPGLRTSSPKVVTGSCESCWETGRWKALLALERHWRTFSSFDETFGFHISQVTPKMNARHLTGVGVVRALVMRR
ncbi:hypothetical protein HK097_008276 [Rhizophlyctis rosea]|uniref:Uncharacterized protein n=1 Tax=Rhizophlyctis rosea TaxID=64517 RepID=A0AAD5SK15_9FUNG|nr:hypothetical protein HK097_008276 [Rhizophlyctis rosea]